MMASCKMEKSQGQRLKGISEPEREHLNGKKNKKNKTQNKIKTPLTQAPITSQKTQHQRKP